MRRPERYPYSRSQWFVEKAKGFTDGDWTTEVVMLRNRFTKEIRHDWFDWRQSIR